MPIRKWKPLRELKEVFEGELAVDVWEDNTSLIIEMHIPGIPPDDIAVEVSNNYLIVKGSREEEKEKKDKHFYQKEIKRGMFERTLSLPAKVIADEAVAEFKNGILKVILPKEKIKKSRKSKAAKK